jgi:hypothetical protein
MSPSNGPHVMECLQENLNILKDALGVAEPKNIPLYNISNALIGMYQDIEAEFQRLNTRLTQLEQTLQRLT